MTKQRLASGTTLAEMPLALWIIIMLCFSLLILATETIRFGFFWNACREAALHAAQCQTFVVDSAVGKSACNTATSWATLASSSFSGITIVPPVNVYILQTDVYAGTTSKSLSRVPLVNAVDTSRNIYDIQVELNGQIDPLISFGQSWFGSVPGLNAPIPVTVHSQYTAEVPQGLNK
ncbi:MAG: hypothetical protein P4L53_01990 [Candidatus Obscuribacterales bacterium]|nr:hypothetical protein [Candidatus Obscuribacterales bacterium]